MFGLGTLHDGAALVGGLVYRPYYVLTFTLAAVVVWSFPQTWTWTRRLTWPRAAICAGLFWLSLLALETQSFNPFIYFIF